MQASGLAQDGVEVGQHFGRVPILGANDLAQDFAVTVDDVGFGIHDRAVVDGGPFGGVTRGREVDAVLLEESAVGGFVFIDTDAEDDSIARGDALLELHESGSLFDARRAPGGPEIEDDDLALILRKLGGLAIGEGEADVFGGLSGHRRFALAIVRQREKGQNGEGKGHAAPSHQFTESGVHIEL